MFPDLDQLLFGAPMLVIDISHAIEAGVEQALQDRERDALIKGVAAGVPASTIFMSRRLGR